MIRIQYSKLNIFGDHKQYVLIHILTDTVYDFHTSVNAGSINHFYKKFDLTLFKLAKESLGIIPIIFFWCFKIRIIYKILISKITDKINVKQINVLYFISSLFIISISPWLCLAVN